MSKEKETVLVSNANMTALVKWANDNLGTKLSGKQFKKTDFQQYIKIERMPENFGHIEIRRVKGIECVKLYDLVRVGDE